MVRIKYISILIIIVLTASCENKGDSKKNVQKANNTDCGCDSLWSKPAAKDFVALLEKTTSSNHPVWKDYNLGDGTYVLNAGLLNDSTTYCLGLWNKGKATTYKCSKDIPTMLTPLYSYYLNYKDLQKTDSTFFGTYKMAPEFSSWMASNQIESAVYMPTDFPEFPFEIPAKIKVQLAIHEAFHVNVMLRYWFTNKGFWPDWENQPDRTGVQSCYTENESVQKLIVKEQETLSLIIDALLDGNKPEAIQHGNEFLTIRKERYNLLKNKQIKLSNDTYGDCKTAEAFMEIEEGIADYASWVKMYDLGVFNRSDLLKRYRADQKDRFYLTGCMLLHASVLMNDGNEHDIIEKMVTANSVEEGNLLSIFGEQLDLYSKK